MSADALVAMEEADDVLFVEEDGPALLPRVTFAAILGVSFAKGAEYIEHGSPAL